MFRVAGAAASDVHVAADEVGRLVERLRRGPVGASARSSVVVARELLERARAAGTEPCVLDGAVAWEVLLGDPVAAGRCRLARTR